MKQQIGYLIALYFILARLITVMFSRRYVTPSIIVLILMTNTSYASEQIREETLSVPTAVEIAIRESPALRVNKTTI